MKNTKNKRGQVLLIAVMLLATIVTVVMTIAFNATTETQVARLESDSQKALAAAQAGVDAVIQASKKNPADLSVDIGGLNQFSTQNITGNAKVADGVRNPYFVSPLLQKDEQYTFYLSDYASTPRFGNPWTGSMYIYLGSEAGSDVGCPSIEVTVVKREVDQSLTLDRYTYNTCIPLISNATQLSSSPSPSTLDSVNFSYKTAEIPVTSGVVAFVKVLNFRTKLGFQNLDVSGALPLQGRTIESEARTSSGVVKKVQLFQSFPQIPSHFFMTSF